MLTRRARIHYTTPQGHNSSILVYFGIYNKVLEMRDHGRTVYLVTFEEI